jgi:uncharacterized protein
MTLSLFTGIEGDRATSGLDWNSTMRSRRLTSPRMAAVIIVGILLAATLACGAGATAAASDELYRAQTIVTGQAEPNRSIGFAACLEDVLIKVSGALQLVGDPRLAPYKSRAADFVSAFHYHDQMSGTPTRDEQGTRDRPYDLIVDFDAAKIDDLLTSLGLKPWLSQRPVLAVFVEMEQGTKKYIVTADARQSDLQRDSLFAAAAKRGVSIVLPDVAALTTAKIDGAELTAMPSTALALVAAGQGAQATLVGHLVWVDAELGWATEWRMDWGNRPHQWQARGITFDEAFRRGLGGAAEIMSGNGEP